MDAKIRQLEREADLGDREAAVRLGIERCRSGQHCWHSAPGMGYMSVYNSCFICCYCGNFGRLTDDRCEPADSPCGEFAPSLDENFVFGQPKPDESPFKIHKLWRRNWRIEPYERE